MRAQKQSFFHSPPDSYGDCHRTSFANLLGISKESVPHLAPTHWDDVEAWNREMDVWLERTFKLRQFNLAYQCNLQELLDAVEATNPGAIYLLAGLSKNGTAHTVVAGLGRILCDPSRDNSGIEGPIDGLYWITLLVPIQHYQHEIHTEAA